MNVVHVSFFCFIALATSTSYQNENLLVFAENNNFEFYKNFLNKNKQNKEQIDKAENLLKKFGLFEKKNQWVVDLSAPELKILEFARAIMGNPQIMLLDEPAAGVNPALLEQLMEIIKELNGEGITFLIVDHNLRFICEISEWFYLAPVVYFPSREFTRKSICQIQY